MKLNNRFIFGLLSLLLAAATAFVALPVIARQTNGKTEIVRVTAAIPKGETVSADNTETVEVGSYNLPPNIARTLDDVKGLYATADLSPGDYILPSKVSPVPVSSDAALNSIPSGKVAISLTIQTLASGLSDKLQPGDIIRIYHFLDTATEVPELRFVKVLSVTDAGGMNVDRRPMGTLANGELRHKRILAHRALKKLQMDRHMDKWAAYIWLQANLKLDESHAHIGMFSRQMCDQVISLCQSQAYPTRKHAA